MPHNGELLFNGDASGNELIGDGPLPLPASRPILMVTCANLETGATADFPLTCPPGWKPFKASFKVEVDQKAPCPICVLFWVFLLALLVNQEE